MTDRIISYEQAFAIIGVKVDNKIRNLLKSLENEGHTEKSISYAIWRTQEKLCRFAYDNRFIGILRSEISKYSWGNGDPRWKKYWEKKNEESELESRIRKDKEEKKKYLASHPYSKIRYGSPLQEIVQYYIYFVQGESGGAIKIGTTLNPVARMQSLQTGFPEELKLLAIIPGDAGRERKIHEYFGKFRLKGEWFKPEAELINMIDKMKTKYPTLNGKTDPVSRAKDILNNSKPFA